MLSCNLFPLIDCEHSDIVTSDMVQLSADLQSISSVLLMMLLQIWNHVLQLAKIQLCWVSEWLHFFLFPSCVKNLLFFDTSEQYSFILLILWGLKIIIILPFIIHPD